MTINIIMPPLGRKFPAVLIRKNYDHLYEKAGVYFIYDNEKTLLYVGQTKNLYVRLNQHLAGRDHSRWFNDMINEIDVYYADDPFEREIYETYAINEFKPAYNTSKVFNKPKSSGELIREEKISQLRDERRQLVSENYEIQERFDEFIAYNEDDLDYEEVSDWGTLLQNRRRINEIDREIYELKRSCSPK